MIVLDTHIWLWWVNGNTPELGAARKKQIAGGDVVAVSAISCFEIAWLHQHRRIALTCPRADWFDKALDGSGIVLMPITPEISSIAVELPEHHRDPQDRIIIATAIAYDAQLMSADRKFSLYPEISSRLL
jgi:PIN domain nuclease of toxin-antitoxin system